LALRVLFPACCMLYRKQVPSERRLITLSVSSLWQCASTCGESCYAIYSTPALGHMCCDSMGTPTKELWLLNFLTVSATLSTRDPVSLHQRTEVNDQLVSILLGFAVSWTSFPSYPAGLERAVLSSIVQEKSNNGTIVAAI
jgi:hypothetical protein